MILSKAPLVPNLWLQSLWNCHPRTSVQSFWEGNWPSSRKRKWQQFLQNLRLLLTSSCYGGKRCFRILVSIFKFWTQCGLLPLRGPTFWVQSPNISNSRFGPSGRRIIWPGHLWPSSRRPRTQHSPARRRLLQPRRPSKPELRVSSAWVLRRQLPCRRKSPRISPFMLVLAREPVSIPIQPSAGRPGELLQLPQPIAADGLQVRARLADFARQWRSLLGTCRATSTVEEVVGITFLHRPQLTHQNTTFRNRNSHQDLQQAVDALLSKGATERVLSKSSLGFYSQLFLVPKKTGDLRSVIDLSPLNRHMVMPHFKMETQGSIKTAIRSQEWTVSIDLRDAYLQVLMHRAVRKYLRFVVNKRTHQFTCLPFGLATSPREFTKLLRPVVALLRKRGGGGGGGGGWGVWGGVGRGGQQLFVHWNRSIRDIMRSHISRWRPTHELIGITSRSQPMKSEPCQPHGLTTVRWWYLTFCQLRFGGRRESSGIPIYETWLVSLVGFQLWV